MKYKAIILLACILLFSFAVRVYNISHNPAGFFCDEASIGYNAYTILKTGRDEYDKKLPLFFEAFGEYKNPVFIYSAVPFVAAFGLNEWSIRLVSVVYGTLGVLAIYLLSKELFNRRIGLFAAFFLAVSPWHIHMSRVGFELISSVFWITFALYLLIKSLKEFRYYPWALGAFLLAFLSYNSPKLVIPPLLVGFAILYFSQVKQAAKAKRYIITTIIGAVLAIGLLTPALIDGSFFARWKQVKPVDLTLKQVAEGYINHFSPDFLFTKGDIDFPGQFVTRHSIRGMGELYLYQSLFLLLGLMAVMFEKKFRKGVGLIIVLLLLYPLGSIFTGPAPQATRSVIGVVPFQIISAIGIYYALHLSRKKILTFTLLVAIILVSGISFGRFWNLMNIYPVYSADFWGWQYGPRDIMAYFKEHSAQYDDLFMTGSFNAPEIFIDFYDPEHTCTNCFIGGIDRYNKKRKQLFAFNPDEKNGILPGSFSLLKTIYYPDGSAAFFIGEIQ